MSLIEVPIDSYENFRTAVLARAAQNLGYDVDNELGYQCWDLAAELWMNMAAFAGQGLYPQTGALTYASEIWTVSRMQNAGNSFDLIYNYTDVKRGDVIVLDASWYFPTTGHVCYADQDYDPNAEEPNKLWCLGQNQDYNHSSPTVGYKPTLDFLPIQEMFLGAFRNKAWENTPPTPTSTNKKRGYKFWIYGNVPKNRRNGY